MRLLGHPIHPMLIVFPIGLLTATVVFDLVYLVMGAAEFATVAFWVLAGGLLGGAAAAVFGLLDWQRIPRSTRAAHPRNSSRLKTLSRLSMRSACVTGLKSVVSARPPTVWVGESWLCNSGKRRSSSSSRCIIRS